MKRNRSKNFLVGNVLNSLDRRSKGTILRSMVIFTAIELCGSILRGKTGQGNTKKNFLEFCRNKYMPKAYHYIAELLYSIFRNGAAHSYIPKGVALLSSNYRDRNKYLKCYSNGLFIYVTQLAIDLRSSIRALYQDIKGNAILQNNYNKVIQQLDTDGSIQYHNYLFQAYINPSPCKKRRETLREHLYDRIQKRLHTDALARADESHRYMLMNKIYKPTKKSGLYWFS